jgi:transposase
MDVMYEVACGLDVHKESVVACVVEPGEKKAKQEVRTFEAHSKGLQAMADWLIEKRANVVMMEGTGIYWRPVYGVLEARKAPWKLVVGNAQHVKNVPGRKTDVQDAQWLASVVRMGLIRPSFIPTPEIRELRDLTRHRKKLVADRTRQQCRVQKVLQAANIKLDGVATDIFGVSGTAMLEALAEGTKTPKEIAQLAKGLLRKKLDALEVALEGHLSEVHRGMLSLGLELLDEVNETLKKLDALIDTRVTPWSAKIERLMTIPGFDRVVAVSVFAELGPDMSVFPSENHCASWAGVCPGNHESAGKQQNGRPVPGNSHLKTMLCQAAQSAARTKNTYLRDKYFRLKSRRGHNKAIMAIAHKLLYAAYFVLKNDADFKELGADYLDSRDKPRVAQQLLNRLRSLGYDVAVTRPDATEAPASA